MITIKQKKILIIDDNENIRYVLRPVLELEGFSVSVAAGGKEGLKKIREDPPDLILLDLMMPEIDGWDVLKEMKAMSSHVPVVMMTAREDEMSKKLSKDVYQVKEYITKPFQNEELVEVISKILNE